MSKLVQQYRQLQAALKLVRRQNMMQESREEDLILDKMDKAWWSLTIEEQEMLEEDPDGR